MSSASRLAALLAAIPLAVLLAACGDDPAGDGGGSGGDASGGSGGSGGSGAGGAGGGGTGGEQVVCSTLPNDAPQVEETRAAAALPTPQGGPIGDGLYFRTATTVYTGVGGAVGPTGRNVRTTLKFTGDLLEISDEAPGGGVLHLAGHFTLADTAMTLVVACPAGLPTSGQEYSSSGDELLLFANNGFGVDTYTRQ